MCGILGIYFQDESKKVSISVLKSMCDSIRHRGPDDEGFFSFKNVGMGVRRLSVIDLIKGHQPIHNEDKTVWVILNGEIYNFSELRVELIRKGHIFYTHTDTEVIVHLYEEKQEECVSDLNGMFALAVFDVDKNKLFIARDRLGIKPLYYYNENGILLFASELKAILSYADFDRQINPDSLFRFFSLNYVPAPETIFKGVKQLLAGHYFTMTKSGFKTNQYWNLSFNRYTVDREEAIIERLQYLLKKSAQRMLKSDVPLGAFLSGGMDSSTIVSLITESCGKSLKTFSVGFREDSYDETPFARLVAERLNTQHYNILCKPDDIVNILPKIVWHTDNLLADPAMLPLYLVSKLAREYVTVCLSGDGGDEIFIGYPTYRADNYLKLYKRIPYFLREFVISKLARSLPASSKKLSFEYKVKKFIEGSEFMEDKAHYWWRTVFSDEEKGLLFSDIFREEVTNLDSYSVYSRYYDNCPVGALNFDKYLYADLKVWLTDNNLIRVDAMSMANSLEVRVPFLDHELVEFVVSISPKLRMKGGRLKYLLKKAMKDRLPKEIINRRKAGWHVPLAKWFQSELRDYIFQTLSNERVLKSGFFNRDYIDNLIKEHLGMRRNNSFKIWGLLIFFHWYETFCLL